MEALEAKHELELEDLKQRVKSMLKASTKKDRIMVEAQTIQVFSSSHPSR